MDKQASEFNLLTLNHTNVNDYLQKEHQRRLIIKPQQHQYTTQSFDDQVKKTKADNTLLSPGASSQRSTIIGDNKQESVQVFVRVRPPFAHEVDEEVTQSQYQYYQTPVDLDHSQHPLWSCVQVTPPSWITLHNYQEGAQRDFQYTQVFGEPSSQQEIFQQSALPLVFHVLNGYHGCYFVYGQTGTGKTYSMGVLNKINQDSQGIIPSSLDFIFRFFEEQQDQENLLDWKVHLSFYQIYQEQIQDLFNPANKNLQVREEFGEVFVEDLVEVPVSNLQQAMTIINAGLEHRQMASQNMNLTSSRSHTILNIDVYQTKQVAYNKQQEVTGRLTLVDLAGSERVRSTTSSGTRLEEAKHINASLSALGNVISSLASSPNKKLPYIPYRSSKLTRVLQNSLSGSSKIVVLATMGPSVKNFQESMSTLGFASRCKDIQLTPVNHASIREDDQEVSALKETIMNMQDEFDKRDGELQGVILSKDAQIGRLQKEIEDMRAREQTQKVTQELNNRQIKLKNQQMVDISTFATQMLVKFVETSTDQVNEAYELNQKLLQLQQTITISDLVRELDSEFPFLMEDQQILQDVPDTEEFNQDDINIQLIVQKMTNLARQHIEHLNFLSQTTNSQILLKQFTRENLDDLQLKSINMKQSQRENLMVMLRELTITKKSLLIQESYETIKKEGIDLFTEKRRGQVRSKIINELRYFIADHIMPQLNFIDGGELSVNQESEIDSEILDVDLNFNFTPPLQQTPIHKKSFDGPQMAISRKSSRFQNDNDSEEDQPIKESHNLSDAFLKMKLLDFSNPRQYNDERDQSSGSEDRESDLSELIMKQNQFQGDTRRNEFTFKKQTVFSDSKPNQESSSDHVIIEEDKESEYSQSHNNTDTNSLQHSPVNQKIASKSVQQLKKMPTSQQPDGAERLMIYSNFITQRCFVRFLNYFLEQEPLPKSTSDQPAICAPGSIIRKSLKVTDLSQIQKEFKPKLIVKKDPSLKAKDDERDAFIESSIKMSAEGFQGLRKSIQNNNINPNTNNNDNRFTFHHRGGAEVDSNVFRSSNNSSKRHISDDEY